MGFSNGKNKYEEDDDSNIQFRVHPPTKLPPGMSEKDLPPILLRDPNLPIKEYSELIFILYLCLDRSLVEDQDILSMKNSVSKLSRNIFLSSVAGIALNIQAKRIPQLRIFNWPILLRIAFLRIPLFLLPFGLGYQDSYNHVKELEIMNRKYYIRFRMYQRTGDLSIIDPTGQIIAEHRRKLYSDSIESKKRRK